MTKEQDRNLAGRDRAKAGHRHGKTWAWQAPRNGRAEPGRGGAEISRAGAGQGRAGQSRTGQTDRQRRAGAGTGSDRTLQDRGREGQGMTEYGRAGTMRRAV